jgi:hypothetical protein
VCLNVGIEWARSDLGNILLSYRLFTNVSAVRVVSCEPDTRVSAGGLQHARCSAETRH